MSVQLTIVEASLADPAHAAAFLELMDAYARDPMEGGAPLPERARRELVPALSAHPAHYVFLAYDGPRAIGFSVCILGFSTFEARPLMNIHDIGVLKECRGRGVGRSLLERIELRARELNCCKLTLEVRLDNRPARGLYTKFGFGLVEVGMPRVPMEFWQKLLR
jgi:ribosomal protein S18 acetylase RimI-like enzyme